MIINYPLISCCRVNLGIIGGQVTKLKDKQSWKTHNTRDFPACDKIKKDSFEKFLPRNKDHTFS
jgi:hypothetical protein